MKLARSIVFTLIAASIISAPTLLAAPCESVESACASTSYQKVDAMLGEKIVADQLQAIGLSSDQARARVSQLSDQQLQQLAAQADLIQKGGTIQGGNVNPAGPFSNMWRQFCVLWSNIYNFLFTWAPSKGPA